MESYGDAVKRCSKLLGLSEEEQESLSKLTVQRNRHAHRYLNCRWQAVKMFATQRGVVVKLVAALPEREERK